ncbi:MAG: hypothetical protein V7K88_22665 [Nostoc sp.]|uniref:WD40 repeat domain-containing protein n=1 Tax=Nostoc sp. TaxID=1180 RepID=UPI002FF6699A
MREKTARVENLLPFKPLDSLVLAIQAMGENLEKLPQQILAPVQYSLNQVVNKVTVSIPLRGHKDDVSSVAISANGQRIVSGGNDGTVRLWNRQGLTLAEPLRGHQGNVSSVAISQDGQTIVSGGRDGTVRLWNHQGLTLAEPLRGHQGYVYSVAISQDGQTIASGGADGTVRLWRGGWQAGCKSVATGCVTIPSSQIRKQRKQKPPAKSAVNMFGVKKKLKAGINKKKIGEINL